MKCLLVVLYFNLYGRGNLKVCHLRCVRSIIQSCSVYIRYSHEHNITISSNISDTTTCLSLHTGPKHVVYLIVTNCNIIVFMTICIYRYIQATALYYGRGTNKSVRTSVERKYTCLLTPWSRVLLQKLTGSAASQEIPLTL